MKGCAFLAIALTGCLETPPAAIDDPASLLLAGVDARGGVILDGRNDLVITGIHRSDMGDRPVALVLFASDTGLETVLAGGGVVALPFEPAGVAVSKREDVTGLGVVLGPDGSLIAFDQTLEAEDLVPTMASTQLEKSFDHLAALETSPGERLLLSDAGELWVTDPLAVDTDFSDVPASSLSSDGTIDWVESMDIGGTKIVGSLTAAGEIATQVFMSGDPPVLEPDLASQSTPVPLGSVLWRGTSHDFVYLVGVDQDIPRLFWHRTPLGPDEITSGFALEDTYDTIFDITFAVVGGATPDLLVLGERAGALVVDMYRDPLADDAFDIRAPASWTVPEELAPPVWIEAMDAIGGDSNDQEIIVYDQAGHIVCVDRTEAGLLSSCGSGNLADLVAE